MKTADQLIKEDLHRIKKACTGTIARENINAFLDTLNTLSSYNAINKDTVKYCIGECVLICKCRELYCDDLEITLNLIS